MQKIIILDFGSQYTQLIARRVRDLGVYAEIYPNNISIEKIVEHNPVGIILSGGPKSVNAKDAVLLDKKMFDLNIPVLGVCYGMQLIAKLFGGKVSKGSSGEYGKAKLDITQINSKLFSKVKTPSTVWMSHFDEVKKLPKNFEAVATSDSCIAAMQNEASNVYAIQFHPEVSHSQEGNKILKNFLFNICKAKKDWTVKNNVAAKIEALKKQVGKEKVVIGLSGGVDSTVAAILLHKAIGKNLTCIFVNNGLLRLNEAENVLKTYGKHFKLNIVYADASQLFLKALKGVSNPEEKRKVIGKIFIDVFSKEANKLKDVKYLAQGTIYPDVIESSSHNGNSVTIKTHHNVGGLPKNLKFELVEPLRDLFKDEVRKIGLELGIDKALVYRHPFPGPGLAVRILGDITQEKINILQQADHIFISELFKHNYYYKSSQAFVVLLPVKTVGVMGDERTYEYTVAIRCVDTTDFMTASFSHLLFSFLENVSTRIINEVKNINRVVYDISNKPPATIEWE